MVLVKKTLKLEIIRSFELQKIGTFTRKKGIKCDLIRTIRENNRDPYFFGITDSAFTIDLLQFTILSNSFNNLL